MAQRNALGRGLDALFSMDEVKTEGSSSINEIELSKITVNPNQPRHVSRFHLRNRHHTAHHPAQA